MSAELLRELQLDRIMQPVPRGAPVVPVSFPVTSFGDPAAARFATLSINPSVIEFTKSNSAHTVLGEGEKRFVDREVLGLSQFAIPNRDDAIRILEGNHRYFRVKPYDTWFRWLEDFILQPIGASFHDGSAVHLDLVQWATDPVWSRIPSEATRESLISEDLKFLSQLLRLSNFTALFLNGRTVFNAISRSSVFSVETEDKFFVDGKAVTVWTGVATDVPFICWSKFLSDNRTTTAQREAITSRVQEFVSGLVSNHSP